MVLFVWEDFMLHKVVLQPNSQGHSFLTARVSVGFAGQSHFYLCHARMNDAHDKFGAVRAQFDCEWREM